MRTASYGGAWELDLGKCPGAAGAGKRCACLGTVPTQKGSWSHLLMKTCLPSLSPGRVNAAAWGERHQRPLQGWQFHLCLADLSVRNSLLAWDSSERPPS